METSWFHDFMKCTTDKIRMNYKLLLFYFVIFLCNDIDITDYITLNNNINNK